MFLYLLCCLAALLFILFATLCLACGLYYLAELVEEYTVATKKVITYQLYFVVLAHIGLWIFEGFPLSLTLLGLFYTWRIFVTLERFPLLQSLISCFSRKYSYGCRPPLFHSPIFRI
eukprot:Colp12_sorted_trinity150504_noHs@22681